MGLESVSADLPDCEGSHRTTAAASGSIWRTSTTTAFLAVLSASNFAQDDAYHHYLANVASSHTSRRITTSLTSRDTRS